MATRLLWDIRDAILKPSLSSAVSGSLRGRISALAVSVSVGVQIGGRYALSDRTCLWRRRRSRSPLRETKELIWRFGKDRNLEFACDIDHHAEDGMKGIFRVAH